MVYTCSICGASLSQEFRIRCAVCPEFDVCGDCFCVGAEKAPHKNTHSYRIVDCLSTPIFCRDWTSAEELLLLEGIDKCGAGNWKVIAEYMGTGKSAKQLEEHYWEVYMGVHGRCLPAKMITTDRSNAKEVNVESPLMRIPVNNGENWTYTPGEIVIRDDGKSAYAKQKDRAEIQQKIGKSAGQ